MGLGFWDLGVIVGMYEFKRFLYLNEGRNLHAKGCQCSWIYSVHTLYSYPIGTQKQLKHLNICSHLIVPAHGYGIPDFIYILLDNVSEIQKDICSRSLTCCLARRLISTLNVDFACVWKSESKWICPKCAHFCRDLRWLL